MPSSRRGVIRGTIIIDSNKMVDRYPAVEELAIIQEESEDSGGPAFNMAVDLARLAAPFPVEKDVSAWACAWPPPASTPTARRARSGLRPSAWPEAIPPGSGCSRRRICWAWPIMSWKAVRSASAPS
jgi:hypothetical protein